MLAPIPYPVNRPAEYYALRTFCYILRFGRRRRSSAALGERPPEREIAQDVIDVVAHLGDLPGRERRLPPGEGETDTRLPGDDAADFECLAACEPLGESPAETWLEGEQAG